ncbi:MAG: P1 family peptidase [Chloroflexales bacterium]|nr:P1 family peptidase [Chloroflexales bacterium]
MLTNDNTALEPQTSFDGPVLEFDFPAFQIGIAEYAEGPTGCTVFLFPQGAATAVDMRGGYPGTINNWEFNHGICLAAGSLYGLEAAFGVATELFAQQNYSVEDFALVSGAIIYDYDPRQNVIHPDKKLGRSATLAARTGLFPLGLRGAGRSATCGWFWTEPSGQGGAFRQIGTTKVAIFSVFNCSGAIVNRQGQVVKGNLDPATGKRCHFINELERRLAGQESQARPQGNTTLTVMVTNQQMERQALDQLGKQVHTAMGRFIQPFHTMEDGDVLYAVTTNEVEHPSLDVTSLGAIAAELAWEAALSIC